MQQPAIRFEDTTPLSSELTRIETTLYDLIEAVNAEVTAGEEHWVALIVHQILESKRVI
jgi:hypothetical protein